MKLRVIVQGIHESIKLLAPKTAVAVPVRQQGGIYSAWNSILAYFLNYKPVIFSNAAKLHAALSLTREFGYRIFTVLQTASLDQAIAA
jgi:hypothetical protein